MTGSSFSRLQKEAVAQLAKHHEASAAWVEVTEDYRIPDWQYREAEEGEQGGVLINLSPTGRVEIREGLVRRDIDRHTAEETADNPDCAAQSQGGVFVGAVRAISPITRPPPCRKCCSPARARPRKWRWWRGSMQFRPHEAMAALAKEAEPQSAYAVLEGQVRRFAAKTWLRHRGGGVGLDAVPAAATDELALYEAVQGFERSRP